MPEHIEHDAIYLTRYANQDIYICRRCNATGIETDDQIKPQWRETCPNISK